jgi:hypothetical protein
MEPKHTNERGFGLTGVWGIFCDHMRATIRRQYGKLQKKGGCIILPEEWKG